MARTQHLSIADFKSRYPVNYNEFAQNCSWLDEVVAFDVVLDDGVVRSITPFTQEDEDEGNMHEYCKDCRCPDCQERRLGVVLEEGEQHN